MKRGWPRGVLSLWVAVAFLGAAVCAAAHSPLSSLGAAVSLSDSAKQLAAPHSAHGQHAVHLQHLAPLTSDSSPADHPDLPPNPENCCILVATKGELVGPLEVSLPTLPLVRTPSWTLNNSSAVRALALPALATSAPPPSLFAQKTLLLC
ncbi:MAG: hypothetical protein A2527_12640 [Candidatus Lambdaproteobacteria bacterium RIFOXYD2_FULL_50_16]|uniref:DUF2946 domain-containing protein n=1 Tax=Candidatus Lambdaproteobacteria bacterium RIFOXYD2_FULL_50_16 TaxID=1817772 RepID=A0A1F6GA97_9PROT|nr:MAG: hypothetical protein A2527_12640 [Candidatus Lambdaproteobacteria bacterium RIFOXYD2_FULL_50_16]